MEKKNFDKLVQKLHLKHSKQVETLELFEVIGTSFRALEQKLKYILISDEDSYIAVSSHKISAQLVGVKADLHVTEGEKPKIEVFKNGSHLTSIETFGPQQASFEDGRPKDTHEIADQLLGLLFL
ncbi:hypothetical protein [Bacillus velezensis]|uniref:hypothetical protein n=1 Tax=Bacillus velezensis TaxID=492670 RepID=UPI003872F4A3